MRIHFFTKKRGFATVEILIASTIVSVALIALVLSTSRAVDISIESVERVQAAFLLEEGAESVKLIRDGAWSSISGLTAGTTYYLNFNGTQWTLSTTNPGAIGIFTRTIVFANVSRDGNSDIAATGTNDLNTKRATVTVSWNSVSGARSESMEFYIANIFE